MINDFLQTFQKRFNGTDFLIIEIADMDKFQLENFKHNYNNFVNLLLYSIVGFLSSKFYIYFLYYSIYLLIKGVICHVNKT